VRDLLQAIISRNENGEQVLSLYSVKFLFRKNRVGVTEFCFVDLFPLAKHSLMTNSNVRRERRNKFPHGVGESATDVSRSG